MKKLIKDHGAAIMRNEEFITNGHWVFFSKFFDDYFRLPKSRQVSLMNGSFTARPFFGESGSSDLPKGTPTGILEGTGEIVLYGEGFERGAAFVNREYLEMVRPFELRFSEALNVVYVLNGDKAVGAVKPMSHGDTEALADVLEDIVGHLRSMGEGEETKNGAIK